MEQKKICQHIYNHRYYLKNKEKAKEYAREWDKRNPEKVKEIRKKSNSLEKTKIKKNKWHGQYRKENKTKVNARNMAEFRIELKPCCEICGSTENLQRHHWNYDNPLLVNTLCKECHDIQHKKTERRLISI
jgi:hypothetical protein